MPDLDFNQNLGGKVSDSKSNWVKFTQTQWTVIFSAKGGEAPDREAAMASLCQSYWKPVYAYIRQKGYSSADAQDLTQEFFLRLLEKDHLQYLTHQNGKFRSFLLTCVNHLLNDERDKGLAQKRGGNLCHFSLEELHSVDSEMSELGESSSNRNLYDSFWARSVLERATERLSEEYNERGKRDLFDSLKSFVPGSSSQVSYEEVATRLGMSQEGLRAAVHRMRRKFGEMIREEVRQTIGEGEDLEAEIRYLIEVVSSS